MKPLISPQLVFDAVGKHIKRFAYNKFGSVGGLAEYLEIPVSYLSQIIHGRRRPGSKIMLKLLARGFDDKLLQFYENLQLQSDYNNLSNADLIMMVERLTDLLNRKEEMLKWYEKRLNIEFSKGKSIKGNLLKS